VEVRLHARVGNGWVFNDVGVGYRDAAM
jgi:hypothetical protein